MPVQGLQNRSTVLTTWLDSSIHGIEIDLSVKRKVLAAASFDTVHEVRKGILLLIDHKLVGPAFALVRPLFETFVRGEWLLRCAPDAEVEQYELDRVETSIGNMINQIEQLDPWDIGLLGKIKKTSWNAMCSYAHGGVLQISRRFNGGCISPNYSPEEIVEIINSSNTIALFAASEIAAIANNSVLGDAVNKKLLEYT
jgi:hypothetical protein